MFLSRRQAYATAALVGLGVWSATQFRMVFDISEFMPAGRDPQKTALSKQLAQSEASRTLMLLVGGESPKTARTATQDLEAALTQDPDLMSRLAFLSGGPPKGIDEALWRLYQPRTLSFVASSSAAAAARVAPRRLKSSLQTLKTKLASSMSPLLSKVAPRDPLLALPDLFDRITGTMAKGLQVVDGRYVSQDGAHGVLILNTRASALSGQAQAPVLSAIDRHFARVNAAYHGQLNLQMGGLHRFSVRIEESIRADITRVSILSVLGLIVLFVVLFRSLRIVGLTMFVISVGMLVGLSATLLVFGRIHGLTLAFGASLIGVAIDYALHFFVHHAVAGHPQGPRHTLARIGPGLILGALTTVVGFTGLAWSSLPGLQEVAVFSATGILAALIATGIWLPEWMGAPAQGAAQAGARRAGRMQARLTHAKGWQLWLFPAGALAIMMSGLPHARWDDDVASLARLDPELVAEEEAVRAQVAPFEQRRFIVAEGNTVDAALRINERIQTQLEQAQTDGLIGGYRSLATLLPSPQTQRDVAAAVRGSPDLWARFAAEATAQGFVPRAFAPFQRTLKDPLPPPLTFDDLADSPLGFMVRSFRLNLDGRVGLVTFLADVKNADELAHRIEAVPGALLFDQSTLMTDANRSHRQRTTTGLCVGLVLVFGLIVGRYRNARRALAAFVPATLAVGVTISVLGLLDLPLNVVALTALLMVFSMGVDYGVFLAEAAAHHPEDMQATLLAVIVAWASTLLGFGLLALSYHPAMRTIGLTAGVGVTASLILAPTALVLMHQRKTAS